MRILFFHEVNYLTKPVYEMHEFPEFLSTCGHDVHFVHFAEGVSRLEARHIPLEQLAPKRSHVVGDPRVILHTPRQFGGGLIARALVFLLSPIEVLLLLRKINPDVVFTYSVATHGMAIALACRLLKIPLVVRLIDVPSRIRKVGPLRLVIRLSENILVSQATAVTCLTPDLRSRFSRFARDEIEKFTVDPPPLNTHHFNVRKELVRSYREKAHWGAKKVFVFLGTFFHFAELGKLVDDFAMHSEETDLLVLFGTGEAHETVAAAIAELPSTISERVILAGFLRYEEIPLALAAADVAINSLRPSIVTNEALPNKVLQYAAAGLPIVSTKLTSLQELFGDVSLGVYWVSEDESITLKCKQISAMGTKRLQAVGHRNKKFVEERFNLESTGRQMERLVLSTIRHEK